MEGAGGFISLGRLTPAELMGCAAAVVLALSLFLPWFGIASLVLAVSGFLRQSRYTEGRKPLGRDLSAR